MKRAEGGRGLRSLEDCVELECDSLAKYIQQSNEILLAAVKRELGCG